ncbi:hypothetical protein [Catenuloplanes atrovinosus]|uniref:Uncharacterized protein n=1 Tax=Catenuloplanes atrovinosus TaxID=137266 RepID=A0AAE3YI40_9ACTN|nr:hypothetical protein [Catenuloplanes atrovinosus]MDR7273860.1 hypothetical protein [Catenuloplanes atrovinosus]
MTRDQHHEDRDERRVWSKIDLIKLSAGTLAAISSAVCASWLGVAGTIVGAAVASVIATVGQELYAHSLKHTYQRLRGVRLEQALAVVGATNRPAANPPVRPADRAIAADTVETVLLDDFADADPGPSRTAPDRRASDRPIPARAAASASASGPDHDEPAARTRFADRSDDDSTVRRAHRLRLVLATVAMFVFAMLAITAFELMAGDSLAGLFGDGSAGATTLPFVTGNGDPTPIYTPEPPLSTVPADATPTAPADPLQSTAPAETPAATDPAPTTETNPRPDQPTDPLTPPAPADQPPPAADPAAPIG